MTEQPGASRQETFRIDGSDLMDKAKQLVDQGNKHRVVVLNEDGKSVFDIPLTVAVVGGIIVFPATAVGVIAALATRHSIVVESINESGAPSDEAAASDAASGTATTSADSPYGGPAVDPPVAPDETSANAGGAPD
jgi:hypothetical protein